MVPFFALFALMPHGIESVAMMIGPVITIVILLCIPFLSNYGERSPLKRPWAMFGVICVFIFVISLLVIGIQAPWSPDFNAKPLPLSAVRGDHADSAIINGTRLFYARGCEYCHTIHGFGGKNGPDLSLVGNRMTQNQIIIRVVNGGTNMPAFGNILSREDLNIITGFLAAQK
jgi:ubiquinol-cytochrome c reductase cytochrome b subunit